MTTLAGGTFAARSLPAAVRPGLVNQLPSGDGTSQIRDTHGLPSSGKRFSLSSPRPAMRRRQRYASARRSFGRRHVCCPGPPHARRMVRCRSRGASSAFFWDPPGRALAAGSPRQAPEDVSTSCIPFPCSSAQRRDAGGRPGPSRPRRGSCRSRPHWHG